MAKKTEATSKPVSAPEAEPPGLKIVAKPQAAERPLGVGTFNDVVQDVEWLKARVAVLEAMVLPG
jgi:hypothetical protein